MRNIFLIKEKIKSTLRSPTLSHIKSNHSTQEGLTLIEVIISIALLAIITIPFLTMFVHSTSTNSRSENIIEGTYLAQSTMEEIYALSITYTYSEALIQLTSKGYAETVINPNNDYNYSKEQDGYYIKIELNNSANTGNLVKALVKIYNNSSMNKLESQIETILSWKN